MPVAAAVQPQVFAGDPHPLEVLRGGQHPIDQPSVLLLDPGALDQGRPRLGDAIGQRVADLLELAEIEDAGRGGNRLNLVRYLDMAESLGKEPAQLRLEPGDLAAQLEPGLALIDRDARSVKRLIE